jgi:hypothetical protein
LLKFQKPVILIFMKDTIDSQRLLAASKTAESSGLTTPLNCSY